ncbi:hypothetical protein ES319_A13G056600v1, partial [Gossypium barbadense]
MMKKNEEMIQMLEKNNKKIMETVVAKPYLQDYTNPKYKSSNTNSNDTCKHVMKFVKTLGFDRLDDDLKLKEFSKSLIEKAYNWNMCRMYREKFFSTKSLMNYIQCFRERVLDIHDAHYENELVKVC